MIYRLLFLTKCGLESIILIKLMFFTFWLVKRSMAKVIVAKEFDFSAAHRLIKYKGKCENLHGHNYRLIVKVLGNPDEDGMVIDFTELKSIVKNEALDKLDHAYINDILEQPTAENISVWIWDKIETKLKKSNCRLFEVEVWESPQSKVIYNGIKESDIGL